MQLQGDIRKDVADWLVEVTAIITKELRNASKGHLRAWLLGPAHDPRLLDVMSSAQHKPRGGKVLRAPGFVGSSAHGYLR